MVAVSSTSTARTARRVLRHLTTPFDPDAYLSALDPRWGTTRLRGVIEQVRPLTPEAAAVTIRPGVSWQGHRAGQHVTLGVDVQGVRHHRCYSLTSPSTDRRTIEVAVQAVDGGTVSTHLVHHARPGEVVQLTQAEGDFTVPDSPGALLFVTGGSGITPVMGILRSLVATGTSRDVVVLHHATDPGRCMFAEELEHLDALAGIRVVTTFTRDPGQPRAHLDRDRLVRLCADWREREAFVCGPEGLIDAAVELWGDAGPDARLRLERFTAPTRPAPPGADDRSTAIARFELSDRDVLADTGTPLLDLAEAAGLQPPSGCRMGICHTCTTRLTQGCVRDLRDGRLHTAGEHVQLCVSAAAGDVVLDR